MPSTVLEHVVGKKLPAELVKTCSNFFQPLSKTQVRIWNACDVIELGFEAWVIIDFLFTSHIADVILFVSRHFHKNAHGEWSSFRFKIKISEVTV